MPETAKVHAPCRHRPKPA